MESKADVAKKIANLDHKLTQVTEERRGMLAERDALIEKYNYIARNENFRKIISDAGTEVNEIAQVVQLLRADMKRNLNPEMCPSYINKVNKIYHQLSAVQSRLDAIIDPDEAVRSARKSQQNFIDSGFAMLDWLRKNLEDFNHFIQNLECDQK